LLRPWYNVVIRPNLIVNVAMAKWRSHQGTP
jgi:hypothetical protein